MARFFISQPGGGRRRACRYGRRGSGGSARSTPPSAAGCPVKWTRATLRECFCFTKRFRFTKLFILQKVEKNFTVGRRLSWEPGAFSLCMNVQRFRGGLVFKAHGLCAALNSRLESGKEESGGSAISTPLSAAGCPEEGSCLRLTDLCIPQR